VWVKGLRADGYIIRASDHWNRPVTINALIDEMLQPCNQASHLTASGGRGKSSGPGAGAAEGMSSLEALDPVPVNRAGWGQATLARPRLESRHARPDDREPCD
jgi:hypothetical protein